MTRIIMIGGYLVIVTAMLVLELYARRKPDDVAPLSDMLADAMASRTIRIGLISAWWWFGWHFFFSQTM
ncbi:hypothetical protein JF66_03950 [Cryobacterium sp. MLB-32]|uniref:DUF6186 family protein n=1 Tax=Cryobacterium sp. MLB-32 TaxID=1529318 RepID=UPI0004E6941F|nr:DUF6186 family protein [Cryobacterium sp. MLB-32]KFF60515.1 hypothetical protein JF66_03950 [Cryobacterium sp. MLB-32]